MKYAQVVFGLPIDRQFTYGIPANFRETIQIGQRVEVPFGLRLKIGYIVGLTNQTTIKKIKPIKEIIDNEPILDSQMLELTRLIADYYCASWGQTIEAACPSNVRKRKRPLLNRQLLTSVFADLKTVQMQENFILSSAQRRALKLIIESIRKRRHQVFLLHGITASGKTEVYLQAIAEVLKQGGSSIVLVPEIALTPQTEERFRLRFGEKIALMHSRLLASERTLFWQRIKNGQAQIVIGARSAVFAPVKNLRLIVVDEEHETTYKQKDTAPRYHARDVAIMRAKLAKATVILGSATPSLESFYEATKGKIKLINLPERVTKRDLPRINIVDMRREISMRRRRVNILSRVLENKIKEVMDKKEQLILFLNRRGFSTFINCARCGYVAKCKRCNVSLVYHYATKTLICHYCNFSLKPPQICPECHCSYLRYFGLGTEKVESELHRLFPQAKIARMDTDVTRVRDAHAKILDAFKENRIDILVGTQMVAKGLDFPRVSLVGVVSADTALNLPDFRSAERTFNLLTQVAGRAGRGESEGEVVIQTYVPSHYAIVASLEQDFRQFYQKEIKSRRALSLPPFTHLISLTLRSRNQKMVQERADELALKLKEKKTTRDIQVFGPAPAVISKMKQTYRWNVLLKGKNVKGLVQLLRREIGDFRKYRGAALTVDVDPL